MEDTFNFCKQKTMERDADYGREAYAKLTSQQRVIEDLREKLAGRDEELYNAGEANYFYQEERRKIHDFLIEIQDLNLREIRRYAQKLLEEWRE